MKVKGIIFDFGFTLFYFDEPSIEKYFECFKTGLRGSIDLLKKHNILKEKLAIEDFIKNFNRKRASSFKKSIKTKLEIPTSIIFQEVLKSMAEKNLISELDEINDQIYLELAEIYHSFEESEWIPFKNTKDTLEKLFLKKIKIALVSNHPNHKTIENILIRHDLFRFFDIVITSAKFGKRKPDPNIFFHTIKKLGLENHENFVLVCGDEYADITGAYRANLKSILLDRKYKFPFEKDIDVPNYIKVKDISEILNFID
ncbi:MAG: HAD family hydrolase [Candidatus Hodarchaeota archaeon]